MVYLPHWPIPDSLGKRTINYESVFERMLPVLNKLGNPHCNLPPIIHIAGTNGKGSTATFLAQLFKCNKNKIHLYTSPHIHHCNERIILDGEMISDAYLYEIMEEVRLASKDSILTFMESITIGAFLAFSKVKADILIVECGMGGRIDATNIIEQKLATIITPISYDHEEYLGHDIRRIAVEKAMIIRPNTPLFCSAQPSKAKEIIKILANDQKIPNFYYDEDFLIEKNNDQTFNLKFNDIELANISQPNLIGDHQYINIATALSCALYFQEKFNINIQNIEQSLKTVKFRSRLEKVDLKITNQPHEIWIDGAHNEAGAFALRNWLLSDNSENYQNYVIVGFSRNKCRPNFLKQLCDVANIVAITVDGEPYPEDYKNIVNIAQKNDIKAVGYDNLGYAFDYIKANNCNKIKRIIICGSLHLARDLKKYMS